MLPTILEAKAILKDAEESNPGPWGDHSRVCAYCAKTISEATEDLDPEKAYILGLLHDIGRKFGKRHLGHVSDGYAYMLKLGYDEVARVCLTHSFNNLKTDQYIGEFDTDDKELELIKKGLETLVVDDYDYLIQLCDALAGTEGIMNIEERMLDVKKRYGSYPQDKWDRNLELFNYFEKKCGEDLYKLLGEYKEL